MPYCPKCGTKVSEEMSFCPNCGAPLKVEKPAVEAAPPAPPAPAAPPAPPYRAEKAEKREKREKEEKHEKKEKAEKHEKREYGYIGPLIGGLILIALGTMFFLVVMGSITWGASWAIFLIVIGIIIIVGAMYAASMAARRHPQT